MIDDGRTAYSVNTTLERLERALAAAGPRVVPLGDHMWKINPSMAPNEPLTPLPPGKDIALTLMGLIHGNEIQGLDVLAELADGIARGWFQTTIPIAIVVGNIDAARQGLRYRGRDMNRCFALPGDPTPIANGGASEPHRARAIEPVLRRSLYLLDFHQTTQSSPHPFFIFPYTRDSYAWAREIDHRVPMVTHWGDSFSSEGICTDEYLNAHGGIGLTVELGQAGVTDYQRGIGTLLGLRATRSVAQRLVVGNVPAAAPTNDVGPIYTWAQVLPWPDGDVALDPGWNNFVPVTTGQRLGRQNGADIVSPVTGFMLFPKYLDAPGHPALTSRPSELCRVMKIITEKDLPR